MGAAPRPIERRTGLPIGLERPLLGRWVSHHRHEDGGRPRSLWTRIRSPTSPSTILHHYRSSGPMPFLRMSRSLLRQRWMRWYGLRWKLCWRREGRSIRFRGRSWFAGDLNGASRHCSVDVLQLECIDKHLVQPTPAEWATAASVKCEGKLADASDRKRDRYGRKPVKVRRRNEGWRQYASCRDALRSTPGLTSYVLSALVNGKLGREGLQLEDFEASFVDDAIDEEGEFVPSLLPNAVHPIPQIPDELPVPGTLIHVDGRTAYAPRKGETLKTIADQLCGVSCSEGRVGPPPLSEGGSASQDLLWLAQLDWSDQVYEEGRLVLLPDSQDWPSVASGEKAYVPPTWDTPTEPGVDVEGSSRWVHASVLLSGSCSPTRRRARPSNAGTRLEY